MKKVAAAVCAVLFLCAAGALRAEDAPRFTLPGADGKTVNVGELIGKKTVVLNFWASWCSSCAEEIPELAAFQSLPGSAQAAFFGINAGETAKRRSASLKKRSIRTRCCWTSRKQLRGNTGLTACRPRLSSEKTARSSSGARARRRSSGSNNPQPDIGQSGGIAVKRCCDFRQKNSHPAQLPDGCFLVDMCVPAYLSSSSGIPTQRNTGMAFRFTVSRKQ
jgi:thiol-disulfide isomerase/thioredoxin